MRRRIHPVLIAIAALAACAGPSAAPTDDPALPQIVSFTVTPSTVERYVPTTVTWSYEVPIWALAACSIDGVGPAVDGRTSTVTLEQDATYTLRCTNEAGESTAQLSLVVTPPPTVPRIASFTSSQTGIPVGLATDVVWLWSFENTPIPKPTCTIDPGVGTTNVWTTTTLTIANPTTFTLTCANYGGSDSRQITIDATPVVPPVLATFEASRELMPPNEAEWVGWRWTFAATPNPAPTCSIDQGVGIVFPWSSLQLTLASPTTFTLTCTSAAGSDSRQFTVGLLPPVAPVLASFRGNTTSSGVPPGVPTDVNWSWDYETRPIPEPSCRIDPNVGPITRGDNIRTVTQENPTTYTLTCTNAAGSTSRAVTIDVIRPPPAIVAFTADPERIVAGRETNVTWSWAFAAAPDPATTCRVDGTPVTNGGSTSVYQIFADTHTLVCSNVHGTSYRDLTIDVSLGIDSFRASRFIVDPGVPTQVTWNWSFTLNGPPTTCAIDHGVGVVTRDATTTITIAAPTRFTLTCTNAHGSGTAQLDIGVGTAVPPTFASASASPATIAWDMPSTVTWAWAFATPPNPSPTCSIAHGVGAVTSGSMFPMRLTHARTYRLTCSNGAGSATADITVGVDECAADTDQCGANARCTDTLHDYACTCEPGFTGDGVTCSALVACGTNPTICDPSATCEITEDGDACVCPPGWVGDGVTCARNRISFVTSTIGTGNLAAWPEAAGASGLAAADAVCQARAVAAGLPGLYVAWLSDASDDAYCRVHGLRGTKQTRCGLPELPLAAGPWVRVDGKPFAPTIDRLTLPVPETYYAALDEYGGDLSGSDYTGERWIFTGTTPAGTVTVQTCAGWTSSSPTLEATQGIAGGGASAWTFGNIVDQYNPCSAQRSLRCMELGPGPELPHTHSIERKVFMSSTSGNGDFATWEEAEGVTGIAGADRVCQARARHAGLARADAFRAWLGVGPREQILSSNGPWVRPDGVEIASDEADLLGALQAPITQVEDGSYRNSDVDWDYVFSPHPTNHCTGWTAVSGGYFVSGWAASAARWSAVIKGTTWCDASAHIYCFEDR